MDPKIINLWNNFVPILGSILGPKVAPEGDQKCAYIGTPRLRLSGVQKKRKRELNESGEKATGAGNILSKRKGGIRAHSENILTLLATFLCSGGPE